MTRLTRHNCGQTVFGGCDPETCERDCFTARAIQINEKYPPLKPVFSTRELAAILIIALAAFVWAAHSGLSRESAAYQSAQRI